MIPLNPDPSTTAATADVVQKAVTTASVLSHIKNNRIEYLLLVGLVHLLGLTDRLWTHAQNVC